MKNTISLMISGLALSVSLAGCGGSPMVDEKVAGDLTSCHRTQWPVACDIEIQCSTKIETCLAAGCQINGTDLAFYPDGTWSGAGRWQLATDAFGRRVLVYGDVAAVIQDDGAPLACR